LRIFCWRLLASRAQAQSRHASQSEAHNVGADSKSDELLSAGREGHRRGLDGGVQRNAP